MDFQKFIEYRNTRNPFSQHMGYITVEAAPGYAKLVKTITETDMNPFGNAHGGVYYGLADTTAGAASATHGRKTVTVNGTYNYLRGAVLGDVLTAEAREVKCGRTIGVYDVEIRDQNDRVLGTGTFTFFMMDDELNYM